MIVYNVVKEEIPEKGSRGPRYPFDSMTEGDVFKVAPEDGDPDLKALKKRMVQATQTYGKKLGRNAKGEKLKDFTIWIAAEEGVVKVGCNSDLTGGKKAAAKAAAPKTKASFVPSKK